MTYLHLCPSIIYTQLQTGPYAYESAFLIRSIAWYLPGLLHELDSKVFEDGWLLFLPNGQTISTRWSNHLFTPPSRAPKPSA